MLFLTAAGNAFSGQSANAMNAYSAARRHVTAAGAGLLHPSCVAFLHQRQSAAQPKLLDCPIDCRELTRV